MLEHCTAYQFLDAGPIDALLARLQQVCAEEQLLGTVHLAPEGINLSLVGEPAQLQRLKQELREHSAFTELNYRHSPVNESPYSKLVVQARESLLSVPLGHPVCEHHPAPHLSPQQLCAWLDEGRPLRLLDARNDYEFTLGHFTDACSLEISQFRDFPDSLPQFASDDLPIVTYCTGGIRCELASAWLQQQGHKEVWQLDGGILNYFEQCGARHWQGECFVFDDRVAIDPQGRATHPNLCRSCQTPIDTHADRLCLSCRDLSLATD